MKKMLLSLLIVVGIAFAEGTLESDSLVLVAIMEANPTKTLWDTDTPIKLWRGVHVSNNRVVRLDISMKAVVVIPTEIGELSQLSKLELQINPIAELPAEIGKLTNLTWLDVRGCDLTTLPTEIGNFTKLKYIWLEYNKITSLPASIGNCVALEEIYAKENLLTELPDELCNLVALKMLKLNGNALASLPDSIGKLHALEELILYDNKLDNLPSSITNLQNIKIENLLIGGNALSEETLDVAVVEYLDQKTSNWRSLQTVSIAERNTFSSPKLLIHNNKIELPSSRASTVSIFSITGRLLSEINGVEQSISLNSLNLASGVYQMRVVQGSDLFTGQFIIR